MARKIFWITVILVSLGAGSLCAEGMSEKDIGALIQFGGAVIDEAVKSSKSSGGSSSSSSGGTVSSEKYSDAEARRVLSNAGISVNAYEPQTSLQGIRISTLNEIIELKRRSGAVIVVTGGTESTGGHNAGEKSHANGFKVDLSITDSLSKYIQDNFTEIDTTYYRALYRAPSEATYGLEGNHWDVVVK